MTNEEKQRVIEWMKARPITMAGAKKMYALAVEALEAYDPDTNARKNISTDWIDSYIGWLNGVGTEFAARDARAINAMLIKWETDPYLPDFGSTEQEEADAGRDRPTDGCNSETCDLM